MWSRFGLDTNTNANSSTILVFESRFRAIDLALIDAILQNVKSCFGLDTNTNANSSTILVYKSSCALLILRQNRRDSAKCDLVLDDTNTNANSSTILVYKSSWALLILV